MAKTKSKKRSPARAAKTRRTSSRRSKLSTKSPARRAAKAKKAKSAKRSAGAAKRRTGKAGRREVKGEGNYTAAREFRKSEENFVRANRSRIPEMGKQAERALEGPEGAGLVRAEEDARSHARE